MSELTEEKFLADVASHEMTVLRDDYLYRHLRFRRPDTITMWFEVVTWPGSLCIDGDMGTYVFRRIEDMLAFFRRDPQQRPIDVYYWTQKITAMDRDGTHEYSPEAFVEAVRDDLNQYLDGSPDDPALRDAVESEVVACADDGKHEAVRAAIWFTYEGEQVFPDFYEHKLTRPSYQYLWCLHAVSWAVKQYDAAKAAKAGVAS